MTTLIFCHNIKEFDLFFKELKYGKSFFRKNYFILKNKDDVLKIKKLYSNDQFFFQEHESKIPEFQKYILNEKIISKFKDAELLFMQNLDYYEFEDFSITSKDSRQTFYYYLNNILQFIRKNKFKNVYFSHTPHSIVEILFLAIFKTLNLKTVFVRGLPIADMYTYERNIFQYFKHKNKKFSISKKNISIPIKQFIKNYKSSFNFASTKPNKWTNYNLIYLYSKFSKLKFLIFYGSTLFFFTKYLLRICAILTKALFFFIIDLISTNKRFKNYFYLDATLKKKNERLQYSITNRLDFEKILLRGYIQKNRYLNYYYSLIENDLNLKKKYIYFPLWFQPSSTTYPFAGRMVDYEISINMLLASIPSNYKILIKESPDIFNLSKHSWFKGNFARNKSFYDEISKNQKIKIVDFFQKDSKLIDSSVGVASLCDKFNLIALIRNKPSITLVDTITTQKKNSYYCKNSKDIKEAIKNIEINNNKNNIRVANKDLNFFFSTMSENSFYNPYNVGFNNFNKLYEYKKAAKLFEKIL